MKYTFGPNFVFSHYHLHVIRNQVCYSPVATGRFPLTPSSKLTRHLSGLFPDVFDETKKAVSDYLENDNAGNGDAGTG